MTKISVRPVIDAFLAGKSRRSNNTATDGKSLWLWGNEIAYKADNQIFIRTCGWFTRTTKDRLTGIPGVCIWQKKGVWYLNGEVWDGSATPVCSTQGEVVRNFYKY